MIFMKLDINLEHVHIFKTSKSLLFHIGISYSDFFNGRNSTSTHSADLNVFLLNWAIVIHIN